MRRALLIALLCLLTGSVPAWGAIAGNPADRLVAQPLEESEYDPAKRCSRARRVGMERFAGWLEANVRGENWGTYRCEMWGKNAASLHAEGRALDWHLDAGVAADRREAARIIGVLLAPDSAGNPQALARRMGIQEIIWDCGYWMAGFEDFGEYRPCYSKSGKLRKKVDPSVAHRNHVHFGMTKDGAAGRTSFWKFR